MNVVCGRSNPIICRNGTLPVHFLTCVDVNEKHFNKKDDLYSILRIERKHVKDALTDIFRQTWRTFPEIGKTICFCQDSITMRDCQISFFCVNLWMVYCLITNVNKLKVSIIPYSVKNGSKLCTMSYEHPRWISIQPGIRSLQKRQQQSE